MDQAKKRQDFFHRYLDEIYDVSDMLNKEGKSRAECRYREIVAIILLFIREDLRAIRGVLFGLLGLFIGLLLRSLLGG